MADGIPMFRREQRRHLLMNGWLIAGFVIVGTAVTNERGIFRPVGMDGMSATARAFIAMASPATPSPRLRDVRSVSSLAPFEVTAPSRDLRRRLIDAIDYDPGEAAPTEAEPLGFGPSPLPNIQIADASQALAQTPAFATPPTEMGISPQGTPPQDAAPLDPSPPIGAVPEPATWAMLILGFGLIGGTLRAVGQGRREQAMPAVRRRRRRRVSEATALGGAAPFFGRG